VLARHHGACSLGDRHRTLAAGYRLCEHLVNAKGDVDDPAAEPADRRSSQRMPVVVKGCSTAFGNAGRVQMSRLVRTFVLLSLFCVYYCAIGEM